MTFDMLYSKIHRATVTDANLNYVGSITIDEDLMKASTLRVGQKVDIVNINNGERFMIEFCPTSGNRDFYIKCGFKYKPEVLDGMYLWIEK